MQQQHTNYTQTKLQRQLRRGDVTNETRQSVRRATEGKWGATLWSRGIKGCSHSQARGHLRAQGPVLGHEPRFPREGSQTHRRAPSSCEGGGTRERGTKLEMCQGHLSESLLDFLLQLWGEASETGTP